MAALKFLGLGRGMVANGDGLNGASSENRGAVWVRSGEDERVRSTSCTGAGRGELIRARGEPTMQTPNAVGDGGSGSFQQLLRVAGSDATCTRQALVVETSSCVVAALECVTTFSQVQREWQ